MSASNGGIISEDESNFFNTIQVAFPDLVNGKINTLQFLESSKGVVLLVDKFGKLFTPVTYDMSRNIEKLSESFTKDKEKNMYLEDMILLEQQAGGNYATDALLWLRRGLHLVHRFFQLIWEDHKDGKNTEDLQPFLRQAYKDCLEKYHGWVGKQLFSLLVRGCPGRKELLTTISLGREFNEDVIIMRYMKTFLDNLQSNMETIIEFYLKHGLESTAKV